MSRKTIKSLILPAAILVAGIVAAAVLLPRGGRKSGKAADPLQVVEDHELIEAVPSDAAIVFCVKDFGRACELLGDTLAVFSEMTSGKFDRIVREHIPELRKAPAIISIHYSKDMPPLLVVKSPLGPVDSTDAGCSKLIAAADSSGLTAKVRGDLVIISSSETIVNSSIRHLDEGHSVLEANGFSEIASQAPGSDVIFASNAYTDKILETYFSRKHRRKDSFFRELALWTAFSVDRHSESGASLTGRLLYGSDPSYYLNVLRHSGSAPVTVADAVPSTVDFIADIPVGDLSSYLKAYRNYLDAHSRLDKYEYTLSTQRKEAGRNAEEWARALNIKEVAVANVHVGDRLRQMLLIKPGVKHPESLVEDFGRFSGFAATLFGDIFRGEDEQSATMVNGWIAAGEPGCVEEYSKMLAETLKERMDGNGLGDRIPQKGCGFWMYHSMTEDPNIIDATFSPLMARGFRKVAKGVTYVPVTLAALAKGDRMDLELGLARTNLTRSKAPASVDRDTVVTVPAGPFKVFNSATGKENTFYQNSHLSICLRDENGKDVWGIPFKSPLCGYVEEVDFYGNGKVQYLFAAGSKLYLIDNRGRFVSGFPVELGKEIAVGPKACDFPSEGGRVLMVLHKDNTVGLYGLDGKPEASWKGITSTETIKGIPELLEGAGKRYWVARTSGRTLIFPFEGGDPLVKGEGGRMIRPDSKITMNEKGTVSAKCYDGKERTFKLDNEKRKRHE